MDEEWDLLAVQWHPECLRADHSTALFDWIATAAAARLTKVDVRLMFEVPPTRSAVEGAVAS
jgi:hypothetical protein